ncbi:MAG: hypothetical protein JO297_08235 [Nitrososphaeraceae archaeon]|nr:hypothetical protein [Nitrososphaeraceae archaeon]
MTKGTVDTILKELQQTEYGEGVIVIHSCIHTLNKACSLYTKNHLVNNNEIVLLLPNYETIDKVKKNLSESCDSRRIDIQWHQTEGSCNYRWHKSTF